MSRFRLRRTDTPVRARTLPRLPRVRSGRTKGLEEGLFHKVLVGGELVERLPGPLVLATAAILDLGAASIAGGPNLGAVMFGQLSDAIILRRLAGTGISFGPVKVQWLTLACARARWSRALFHCS